MNENEDYNEMIKHVIIASSVKEVSQLAQQNEGSVFYIDMLPIVEKWSAENDTLITKAEREYGFMESIEIMNDRSSASLTVRGYPTYILPITHNVHADMVVNVQANMAVTNCNVCYCSFCYSLVRVTVYDCYRL